MQLTDVPLVFALVGLVLYTVLGGADFGAGLWQLTAGRGPGARKVRDHAHDAMAPVWEANHVWLVFVLTVVWTAYPVAFGSIASTLSVPLFVAAIGIVFRGAAYALQSGTSVARERRVIDAAFSVSSILTPFALGAAVGGIASGRVPVGNAAGDLVTSWLNPTSVMVGVLAVGIGAYLAAVYLAADARRQDEPDLERRFRARALGAGVLTGAVAAGGLAVLAVDAPTLFRGLLSGPGLVSLVVSALAGLATLGLVWRRRFGPARWSAALAVAAVVLGWALAQRPVLLPGLTIAAAAAPTETLVAVIVAVLGGAVILFPALGLLFGLVLGGRFDPGRAAAPSVGPAPIRSRPRSGLPGRAAAACLLAGIGLLNVAESGWLNAVGVVALLAFVVLGFLALAPAALGAAPDRVRT